MNPDDSPFLRSMNTDQNIKILMELRTCFEGFAGIPQETRLLFSAFLDLPGLQMSGLINHTGQRLGKSLVPGVTYKPEDVHKRYDILSKFVVSTVDSGAAGPFSRLREEARRELTPMALSSMGRLGAKLKLYEFDGNDYYDFIWETLFASSLPPVEVGKIAKAQYRTLSTPWRSMHRAGLIGGPGLGQYPVVDTSGYDIVLAQTPYPARLTVGSRLLVRYHDAIPMFQSHTIPTARFHRKSHYRALLDNSSHAVFACTSHAVRQDLLNMFPSLEKRSTVVHDVVSHSYFPETASPGAATEIIRSRLNPKTEPRWGTASGGSNAGKSQFYEEHLFSKSLRFLLMVSSIEPRKNHKRLMRAWELLRARGDRNLKLVLVGSLGWQVDGILESLKPWQERGALFHLSGVPSADLRQLFVSAECVICPSIAEGFDLSGIEAMMCGGVVAASDIPVHREVYGDAAKYFDKYSVEQLAEVVGNLIDPRNELLRQELRELGIKHAQQYKREIIAPQWNELFKRVCAGDYEKN